MRKLKLGAVLVGLIVGISLIYWLASPLVITKRVDEISPVENDLVAPAKESQKTLTGNFVDADSFHKASGTTRIVKTPGGIYMLRLESFKVTNGPDLYVYLSKDKDVSRGFHNLGRLKGNEGNQNYELPSNIDPAEYRYVLIWCKAFSVLFGSAELTKT